MSRRPRRGAWLPLPAALVAVALPPVAATAEHRFEMSGSVALTETYDDNVFALPDDRRQDVISRLTPRLGATYRSPRLTLLAQYARDIEAFSRQSELNTARARQEGTVGAQWSPGAGFDAAGSASYMQTHTPGEFGVISGFEVIGLELRRSLADRFSTTGSLSQRLGARTRAVAEYGSTQDEIVGGLASTSQVAAARLERRVGPVDALSVSYDRRWLRSAEEGFTSHALTVTWVREVTRRAHLELKAGPRLSGERVRPELGATLRHRFRRGDAALVYAQTETAVIGHPMPVSARALSATFTHSLRRNLTATAGASIFQGHGQTFEATVYGMSAELTCRLSRHLSLAGTHHLSIQYGEVEGRPRGEIVHNTVLLRLVAGSVH